MKSHVSYFLGLLIKLSFFVLFFCFFSKKIIACRIMAPLVKTTMTKVLIRRGLNYRETVETDNTGLCC